MYNKDMADRHQNTTLFFRVQEYPIFRICLHSHASLHPNGQGFFIYPVSSKRESRYNEECVTENIAPGIIAHLALHRSGVL